MFKNRKRKGFTLIELVIVIAIIGILVAIAVPKFSQSTTKARNSKIEANARAIASAVAADYADNGSWKKGDNAEAKKIVSDLGLVDTEYTIEAADSEKIVIGYKADEKFDGTVTKNRAYNEVGCTTHLNALQGDAKIFFKF